MGNLFGNVDRYIETIDSNSYYLFHNDLAKIIDDCCLHTNVDLTINSNLYNLTFESLDAFQEFEALQIHLMIISGSYDPNEVLQLG